MSIMKTMAAQYLSLGFALALMTSCSDEDGESTTSSTAGTGGTTASSTGGTGGVAGGGTGGTTGDCAVAPVDCPAAPTNGDFTCYEDLGYCQFLVAKYPYGLTDPSWGGIYSTFTPNLACAGEICADHRVCSESTSLLARLAELRGDQATYEQMQKIWFDINKHYSANNLAHWVLDSCGTKIPEPVPGTTLTGYLNASGEEVRMLLALVHGGSQVKAVELGMSMKDKLFGSAADPAAPYLLRPWWAWSTTTQKPLSTAPDRVSLNVIIPLAYYLTSNATGLPQNLKNFFAQVLGPTLSIITGCAKGSMFQPQYDLASSTCMDEDSTPGGCQVLACADIATRLIDYDQAAGLPLHAQASIYLDFLEAKYLQEGVLWNAYEYGGQTYPVAPYASLVGYVFLAKLAMTLQKWDLAEKIFMEQVIPKQAFPGNNHPSTLLGAFLPRLPAVTTCWNDAQAFPNLEAVTALHIWNTASKNGWTSTYPTWVTIPSMQTPAGGMETVQLDVDTQYVRLLLKKRGGNWGNYSIYEIEASSNGVPLTISSASASSVQWDTGTSPAKAWTTNLVFDGDTTYSRWSSSQDNSDPQWIYIDFGQKRMVSEIVIHWENAYAAEYDVQWAQTP